MPTRNVVLSEHQARLVKRLVKSGRYQNASEVLREGLRLIEDREAANAARVEALRLAADRGIADIKAGRFLAFGSGAELDQHLSAAADQAIADPDEEQDQER